MVDVGFTQGLGVVGWGSRGGHLGMVGSRGVV